MIKTAASPAPARPDLEIYLSIESIWSHIGLPTLRRMLDRHGIPARVLPVPLQPLFAATGGVPLRARPPGRQRYRDFEVQRWCAKRGIAVDLGSSHLPPAAELADRMIIACSGDGANPFEFIELAMRAAWCDMRDIADRAVLAELAHAAGLDTPGLIDRASSAEVGAVYQANLQRAIDRNVFGAPSFLYGDEVFWGQDRLEMLEDAWIKQRKPYGPLGRPPAR